jgi:hypothetical protein
MSWSASIVTKLSALAARAAGTTWTIDLVAFESTQDCTDVDDEFTADALAAL